MLNRFSIIAILLLFSVNQNITSQELSNYGLSTRQGLKLEQVILSDSSIIDLVSSRPLFSFELNGRYRESDDVSASLTGTRFAMNFEESLRVTFTSFGGGHPGWRGEIVFENRGFDTLVISNVLPFGENPTNVYITGKGPWNLARAWLHRPGYDPLRVILPDNAWEAGYCSFDIEGESSVAALIRRGRMNGASRERYNTVLPPRATVAFNFYGETYNGDWQEGMRKIFNERYLYDLYDFDYTLFERDDLKWIRESYLIALQFAWDRDFYDRFTGKYNYGDFIRTSNRLFGHLDVFGIWPTWPRLGVDRRNQWDMYENLPGGTEQLRNFARLSRQYGTRFFIAYNPWDQSTRSENQMSGMARLIESVEADGVVLDTRGASSFELQQSADSVREGVVMYSEGMAVVADMPGIVSGRVHNAIFLSPELNLNKLIKPDFAIFRVLDVGEAPNYREIAIAFFNGYGSELNLFRPGRDHQVDKDYALLARTTMILRENSDAFLDMKWLPLLNTGERSVHINRWSGNDKVIYTALSMNPAGLDKAILEVEPDDNYHFVNLWRSEELLPEKSGNRYMLKVTTDPFPTRYQGTRLEGAIDCIARLPKLLKSYSDNDTLRLSTSMSGTVKLYLGEPGYQGRLTEFALESDTAISMAAMAGDYEGKVVIQLFNSGKLKDVNVIRRSGAMPWLISTLSRTEPATRVPREMVAVPGARISYTVTANDNFVPHPAEGPRIVEIDSFLIDRYPVTNLDYYRFISATGYLPLDTTNYLKHWKDGLYVQGQDNYPVVYVSIEDARAYAEWAGKRLPTEHEWQLAAQGTDGRAWPWGNEFHGTKCNNAFDRSTPVDAFPKGESPYGVMDLVGNVWQLTNDIYSNGTNYFAIIRGGSFYKPTSSWWYVEGGPQPLNKTQMLLLVSPGFDRNETVGFRCVMDTGIK